VSYTDHRFFWFPLKTDSKLSWAIIFYFFWIFNFLFSTCHFPSYILQIIIKAKIHCERAVILLVEYTLKFNEMEKLLMWFIFRKERKLSRSFIEKFHSYNGTKRIIIVAQSIDEGNIKKLIRLRGRLVNWILKIETKFTIKKKTKCKMKWFLFSKNLRLLTFCAAIDNFTQFFLFEFLKFI
jgi:hypothetical protein